VTHNNLLIRIDQMLEEPLTGSMNSLLVDIRQSLKADDSNMVVEFWTGDTATLQCEWINGQWWYRGKPLSEHPNHPVVKTLPQSLSVSGKRRADKRPL